MAFPPNFLDEIRTRISVSDVCGRKVKLIRRGREFVGLSPFNNEKTPSFTVNDEKGFYHCFSSGKHGDIFSYVMETEGLSFPEAVEKFAEEAGLEMPRQTPRDRAQEERRKGLHDVLEDACAWFEARLRGGGQGAAARAYLTGRGLDDATIRAFRLGYAPDGPAFARAMQQKGHSEAMLAEAGLLRRPDDGRSAYAFFRDRVMFPIADRSGKVIAFGGRLMGDAKAAKYINSPDTPLFDKGRTLYNLGPARQAAHDAGRLLVTEGYMDVIALARAGFAEAVAPLGTAMTETQLREVWRMVPEPILCFDGDAAGQRAAERAAERALPLLEPGKSLQFAYLPSGEDPDSLIQAQGAEAMDQVVQGARPLVDLVWTMEVQARPIDTPERRADLETRLRKRVGQIADATVRQYYSEMLRNRLWEAFRGQRRPDSVRRRQAGTLPRQAARWGAPANLANPAHAAARRRQQVLLATMVNNPGLYEEFAESLAQVEFDSDLDKFRQDIHDVLSSTPDLDSEGLQRHLSETVNLRILKSLLSKDVLLHASRPGTPIDEVQTNIQVLLARMQGSIQGRELREQGRIAGTEGTADAEARFLRLRDEVERVESDISKLED